MEYETDQKVKFKYIDGVYANTYMYAISTFIKLVPYFK